MNNKDTLVTAVEEAARFIALAQVALDEPWTWSSKHRAAAKRASMDLTRALAEYRGRTR